MHKVLAFIKQNLLTTFLLFLYTFVLIALISDFQKDERHMVSFQRWREFSSFVSQQKNFYLMPGEKKVNQEYPHLPMMYILMYPFHQMSNFWGAVAWMTLKFLMVILIFHVALSYIRDANIHLPPWLLILIFALSFRYFKSELLNGNVDLLIGGIIAASLYFLRKNNHILCGGLIGLAAVLKLTPLLFLPYFFVKRMWKCFAFAMLAIAFFILLPAVFIGWNYNVDLCKGHYHQMLEPFTFAIQQTFFTAPKNTKTPRPQKTSFGVSNVVGGLRNQSLSAVMLRLCSNTTTDFSIRNKKTRQKEYHKFRANILNLSRSTVGKISKILSLLLFATVMFYSRTNIKNGKNIGFLGEFAIIFLATLCISDRTWKIHGTLLIFAHIFLSAQILLIPKKKWFPLGVLATNALLYLSSSSFLVGKYYSQVAEVYGVHLFIYLILIIGCIYSITVLKDFAKDDTSEITNSSA